MNHSNNKFFKGEIVFAVILSTIEPLRVLDFTWSNCSSTWEYTLTFVNGFPDGNSNLSENESCLYATFREAELARARANLVEIRKKLSEVRQEELDCQNLIDRLSVQVKSLVHVEDE